MEMEIDLLTWTFLSSRLFKIISLQSFLAIFFFSLIVSKAFSNLDIGEDF
jgi:hypothetical protein